MHKGYLCLVLHAHLPFVRHPEEQYFLEENLLQQLTLFFIDKKDIVHLHLRKWKVMTLSDILKTRIFCR